MTRGWRPGLVALLGVLSAMACGKSSGGPVVDAGPHGPTKLTVKWTFTGKAASGDECSAHNAEDVYVNMSGTIDPELHQKTTVACSKGSVDFGSPLIEKLGQPYIEAALLDKDGISVAVVGQLVTPTTATTEVVLDFFPAMNVGGMGGSSSSSTSASSTTSSSGMGGTGGAGGMTTTTGTGGTTTGTGGTTAGTAGSGGA